MVEDLVIYPHKVICSSYLIEFRTYGSLDEFGRQSSPVFLPLGATWIPVNRTQERDKPARNCSKDTAVLEVSDWHMRGVSQSQIRTYGHRTK